jgi:hypothetical protein
MTLNSIKHTTKFLSGWLLYFLQIAFPYLVVICYTLLIVEAYVYPGYFRKLLFIDAQVLAFLIVSLGLVTSLTKKQSKNTETLTQAILSANMLLLPALAIIFVLLTMRELNNFPNYVFSTFHIHPAAIGSVLVFNVGLVAAKLVSEKKKLLLMLLRMISQEKNYTFLVITLFMGVYLFSKLLLAGQTIVEYYSYIVMNPLASYTEKLTNKLGDYPFYAFVTAVTPPDAVVLLPPQESPWLTSGNRGYIRNLLYPRKVVQGTYDSQVIPAGVEYVLIAKGEWPVLDHDKYGWPKATMSAQRIWYYNGTTDTYFESSAKVFDPTLPENKEGWGLIQLPQESP